jgi:hypothetical protein
MPIIFQKLRKHVLGRDISLVIVDDALNSRDVPDRMQGRSAELPHALRNRIGCSEYLLTLLIEKMIVAEMRTRHMPMKIHRLHVKGEHVGQDDCQGEAISSTAPGSNPADTRAVSGVLMGRFSRVHRFNLL